MREKHGVDAAGQRGLSIGDESRDDGFVLDVNQLKDRTLQIVADGNIVLIPQPSDDTWDPLNWSSRKKHSVLFVISYIAFLPDFASALGTVTLIPQAAEWHLSPQTVQHNVVGNIFCLGAGGLIAVTLSNYFGRLPVLFWCQLITLGTSVWCARAQSFDSYLAARIVSGLFGSVAQAGGLMWIQDMFFVHEHPRKINIWSVGIVLSPYLGPLVAAFVISKTTWRWAFYVVIILNAIGVALILLFGDETYYRRGLPKERHVPRRSRALRILGVERHSRQSMRKTLVRPAAAVIKLPVLAITIYYFLIFAWVIGVNATTSVWLTGFYQFKPKSLGFYYFAPLVGSVLGALLGHWSHDVVGAVYAKRHGGRISPEARLYLCYPSTAIMVVGIVILGLALQNHWHYMVVAVFAAVQVAGIMIATTAVNAYLLDCYPEGSGEVGAWISFARALGGFMATYIEISWVTGSGAATALGIQAGITGAAGLIPLLLQSWGAKVRRKQGHMQFPD